MFDNVFLMKNLLGQPPGNVKCHGTQEQHCAEPFATWLPEQECLEIAPEEDCQHLVPLHLEDDLWWKLGSEPWAAVSFKL